MKAPRSPSSGGPLSYQELHRRRCFHIGITDPEKVTRLWEVERVKIDQRQAAKPKSRHLRRRSAPP